MSRRKQAAIVAAQNNISAAKDAAATNNMDFANKACRSRKTIAVALSVGLLLAGATIASSLGGLKLDRNDPSASGSSAGLTPSTSAAPAATSNSAPRLSKEYVYASGGRLLAVQDASAPGSAAEPADLVVWRQSSGTWYIRDSNNNSPQYAAFGQPGDVPTPADFDGDALADFCVFRPNAPSSGVATWFIQGSNGSYASTVQFGLSSDKPVPADYDGDGRADAAIWRRSNKTFYVLKSSTNTVLIITSDQFPDSDKPVPADYDGDGLADAAVFVAAQGNWIIKRSRDNQISAMNWGVPTQGDMAVAGDYDGDGRFDLAIRRDNNQTAQWQVLQSSNNQVLQIQLQPASQSGDISVAGDYDGDGKTDAAVWRPSNGTWYIRKSSNNQMRVEQWGASGDVPVPAPMKR